MDGAISNDQPVLSATLNALFNAIEDGICILDGSGYTVRVVNKAFERIFEKSSAELKGKTIFDLSHDQRVFRTRLIDSHRKLSKAEIIRFEADMRRDDGTRFPVLLKLGRIADNEADENGALLLIVSDVTQQVNRDQSLAELESRYRLLFDQSNDAIIVADIKTEEIIEVNRAAETQTGYKRDELIGKTLADLTPPSKHYLESEGITKLYADGSIIFEETYIRKDKAEIPVQISMALAHLSGRIVIISSFRDISQQREIEKERLKTARLDAVRKIAGGIAHEANQPLQALMSIADIIDHEEVDNKRVKELVSNIPMLVNRMDTLLRQMLRIVRFETKSYTDESDIADISRSTGDDEVK